MTELLFEINILPAIWKRSNVIQQFFGRLCLWLQGNRNLFVSWTRQTWKIFLGRSCRSVRRHLLIPRLKDSLPGSKTCEDQPTVSLLGVDCFVMRQTPTNPLWKCSRACSNSVRWKSASAFVRVIPIWSARNLGGDLINYSLAAIQQGIPSLIWFGLQRGEYLTATNLILVIHKRIPQHNLSILQRPCPKGKPAVASAESMSNEKWTYLWAS